MLQDTCVVRHLCFYKCKPIAFCIVNSYTHYISNLNVPRNQISSQMKTLKKKVKKSKVLFLGDIQLWFHTFLNERRPSTPYKTCIKWNLVCE